LEVVTNFVQGADVVVQKEFYTYGRIAEALKISK
jgi:hypothetical protein